MPFGISEQDRFNHLHIIGQTGTGKTSLMKRLAIDDIQNGHGLAFFDLHGKAALELLEYVPPERMRDVVYLDPSDHSAASVGTPYVDGASVTAEVLEEIKGDKIDVIKFKRRKGYRRKTGHTQRYLRIRIEEITGGAVSKPKPRTKNKTTTKTVDE